MTVLPSDVGPFDALTDRWLIEALSQMSSNPRVRCAAAAWLDARRTALELGLAEEEAQARADAMLQREVGTDSPRFGHERQELVDEVALATATHPYTRIIESLPVKSPIWTATLIGAIGDVGRFSNVNQFKAYLGWSPQFTRSGSSVDHTELAKTGVRPARNVLGQRTVIMLPPTIRA